MHKSVKVRKYRVGDEEQIVKLLNLCFGHWGSLKKWEHLYLKDPHFSPENIVILEANGKIIGHGGLHFRKLILPLKNEEVLVAILSDAAIHPSYRGKGLYKILVKHRESIAYKKGVRLLMAWHLRGSPAYRHNIKRGFIEIPQLPFYVKVINPKKLIKRAIFDFIHKNIKLQKVLKESEFEIILNIDDTTVSLTELMKWMCSKRSKNWQIKVYFSPEIAEIAINFRAMNSFLRTIIFLRLLLTRKLTIKITPLRAILRAIILGVKIVRAL